MNSVIRLPHLALPLLCGLLLLSLTGCRRSRGSVVPDLYNGATFLHVSIGEMGTQPHPRSDGGTSAAIGEDYVDEVVLLIYDAETGMLLKQHFSSSPSFVIELRPRAEKRYHFCFVANYSQRMGEALLSAGSYDDLKRSLRSYEPFEVSGEDPLPMSRIYESQEIPVGGTSEKPIPFSPTSAPIGSLAPVSSFPAVSDEPISTVNLVRCCAKVSVRLDGDGASEVAKLELYNAPSQQSLMENGTALPDLAPEAKEISLTNGMGKIYLPERLLGKAIPGKLGCDTATDKPVGSPTYLALKMKSSIVYKIPVITAKEGEISSAGDYLSLARSNKADFSIIRNRHYDFSITIPGADQNSENGRLRSVREESLGVILTIH